MYFVIICLFHNLQWPWPFLIVTFMFGWHPSSVDGERATVPCISWLCGYDFFFLVARWMYVSFPPFEFFLFFLFLEMISSGSYDGRQTQNVGVYF